MKRIEKMQENERRLKGKTIIGIDPAKSKHQARVLTPEGTTAGKSFSFATTYAGFTQTLPRRIQERTEPTDEIVFAIEEEFDITVPFNANDPSASDFDISSVQAAADGVDPGIPDEEIDSVERQRGPERARAELVELGLELPRDQLLHVLGLEAGEEGGVQAPPRN